MTYAIGEIIVYIVLAALVGLIVGYLLWYRRIAGARTETNIMASVLQERSATLDLCEKELSATLDERDHLRAEAETMASNAERHANEVETLRGQVSQLRPLAHRVPELRSRVDEIDAMVNRVGELEDQNEELTSRANAAERALRVLTEERDRLLTAVVVDDLSSGDNESADAESAHDHSETHHSEGSDSGESLPSFVGSEPLADLKAHPDDLQLISGVGPHLEGLLNQNGIFTFRQIARLTDQGLTDLDDQLGFKGRIERDEWVRQAATLHRLKFGEAADE